MSCQRRHDQANEKRMAIKVQRVRTSTSAPEFGCAERERHESENDECCDSRILYAIDCLILFFTTAPFFIASIIARSWGEKKASTHQHISNTLRSRQSEKKTNAQVVMLYLARIGRVHAGRQRLCQPSGRNHDINTIRSKNTRRRNK
jgi:hypothetical protein